MHALLRDTRYALRGLVRSPGFTLAAVLSLALGIGANTAVFTLVDRVLMKPLPVPHPDKLVLVTSLRPDGQNTSFAYPFYTALRDSRNAGAVFNGLIARTAMPVNSVAGGRVLRLRGELVSGNYFDALGVKPMLGRAFRPEEDRTPGTHPVAVISYGFWQRAFELAPDILGTKIQINNSSYTVIGVAAKEFNGTDIGSPADAWVPMMMQAQLGRDHLSDPRTNWLEIIGRLKDGVAMEQAEAAVSLESLRYARTAQTRTRQWRRFPELVAVTVAKLGSRPLPLIAARHNL